MTTKHRFSSFILLALLVLSHRPAFARVEAVLGGIKLEDNPNLALPIPAIDASEIILSRKQYVVSYNKKTRSPNWVAWKVEAKELGTADRTNAFATDKDLEDYFAANDPSQHAVRASDYVGSCFDRGHQAPSGDRTDNAADNEATFLMSNMIPQTQYLNRIIWEQLEQYTRDLVLKQKKKVYVIAGPIYDEDFGAIGPKKDIPVPSKDFKVIIILDANQTIKDITAATPMITVVMPNRLQDGRAPVPNTIACEGVRASNVVSAKPWQSFQTSLRVIETLSKISFSGL